MFRSYFKTAWRNLWHNKFFSSIKILGLSIGLMVCLVIFLYTKDELSYDRFHQNGQELFRVIQAWQIGKDQDQHLGTTNRILGETIRKEVPEVLEAIHINGTQVTVRNNNDEVFTESPMFVDENFFSVFSFPLIDGNAKTALNAPFTAVLSRDMVKKYFPENAVRAEGVIGRTIQVKINETFETFTISAVAENPPQNSTIKAGIYLPFRDYEKYNDNQEWLGGSMNTFLLLRPGANVKMVEEKIQALFDRNTKGQIAQIKQEKDMDIKISLSLQPLTAIHLSTTAGPDNGMTDGSSPMYSYILTCIAVFILVIACINFINLAIGQSLKRSREIGVRKVLGSSRKQLIRQFLIESFLVASIAFVLAILLAMIVLPFFNKLANKNLSLTYLADQNFYVGSFLLLLLTSFVAGFYPSLVLSSFRPVNVLYGKRIRLGRNYLTKGLIVLQFGLAIFLIIATMAIHSQLDFLSKVDLGYDTEHLVRIVLPVRKSSDQLPAIFRNELSKYANVISVAARNAGRNNTSVKVEGKAIDIEKNRIDAQFIPTFKIPMIAGRNFSPEFPSDSIKSVIVNESFVMAAGWNNSDAIGKTVNFQSGHNLSAQIIGVVRDYHFNSLKEKIKPELLTMDPNFNYGQLWVRIKPDQIPATIHILQATFKKLVPYFPCSYQFMDEINARNYESEQKWKQMIGISSALFVFISCIGLLGLVNLSIEQRSKEIGIRKILGAAVSRILILISKDFIFLILIAFVIALPLGYMAIKEWLEGFPYRATLNWSGFIVAGILVILIAGITISLQAFKTANANPIKSLRSE